MLEIGASLLGPFSVEVAPARVASAKATPAKVTVPSTLRLGYFSIFLAANSASSVNRLCCPVIDHYGHATISKISKFLRRVLDATLGKWMRHLAFVLVRSYYGLFYNISCSNKHTLQDLPGALILATHVSRHDGQLIAAMLYSSMRVRPTAYYKEYYHWAQWLPMVTVGTIPMSSPKTWSPERRIQRKADTLEIMRKVMENGNSVLLFPAGWVRQQEREKMEPHYSGAYETLKSLPDRPVVLLRIDGLGQFQFAKYDHFWSFIGKKKGRRHVNIAVDVFEDGLNTDCELAEFNAMLEDILNEPIETDFRRHHPEFQMLTGD